MKSVFVLNIILNHILLFSKINYILFNFFKFFQILSHKVKHHNSRNEFK
jgi:hypothetical protein